MSVLSEVEETIKRINAHPGVMGCLVANHDAESNPAPLHHPSIFIYQSIAIRTTMENSLTVQYAALVHQLTSKAKSMVRDIEPSDDVTFIRIRTRRHELMIAPGKLGSVVERFACKRDQTIVLPSLSSAVRVVTKGKKELYRFAQLFTAKVIYVSMVNGQKVCQPKGLLPESPPPLKSSELNVRCMY